MIDAHFVLLGALFSALNGAIILLTIDHWDVATWGFPVYIAAIGSALTLIIVLGGRDRRPAVELAAK